MPPKIALDRRIFLLAIAFLAICADIVTVWSAYKQEKLANYFSINWFATIIILLILSLVALGCVFLAARATFVARYFALVWGLLFVTMACVIFNFHTYIMIHQDFGWIEFFGVIFVTLPIGLLGIFSIALNGDINAFTVRPFHDSVFRFPSYIFGISSLIYLYFLSAKYVSGDKVSSIGNLFGEIFLLIFISVPFFWSFFESLDKEQIENQDNTED